jgi:hypothetical protein
MARIDLGGDDSQDDLAEALRQLEDQQQKRGAQAEPSAAPEDVSEEDAARRRAREEQDAERQKSRDEVQGAVEAIRERQVAERAAPRARGGPARWIARGAVGAALIAAAVLLLRPEPLPPPAATPQEAVEGFWQSMVGGHYRGATVFYPALVDKYGSRRQAALHLEQMFGDDPPVKVSVGDPEELPDSGDLRVTYEVWRRSGRPRTGELIVRHSGSSATGYVIIYGP